MICVFPQNSQFRAVWEHSNTKAWESIIYADRVQAFGDHKVTEGLIFKSRKKYDLTKMDFRGSAVPSDNVESEYSKKAYISFLERIYDDLMDLHVK